MVHKLVFYILLLIPGVSFLVSASVDASSEVKERYVHYQEKCVRCHMEKEYLQTVLTTGLGKCQNCHDVDKAVTLVTLNDSIANISSSNSSTENKTGVLHKVSLVQNKSAQKSLSVGVVRPADNNSMKNRSSNLGDDPNRMVLIPAGSFLMGTDTRLPDEGPQHRVTLPPYYIDVYEVTNLQYKKFNDATNGRSPAHWRNRTFPKGKADHPVVFVTWDNANEYCRWAGKRLPTDQEWEKAARGTDGRMFPWGDEFSTLKANTPLRWQEIGRIGDTMPVGSFEEGKSPYGLYDVSGNVWEWTASWYKAYPGNKTESESYGERYKTLKGGSWFDCSFYKCGISAPVFNRAFFSRKVKNDSFGFRCAKDFK